MKKAVLKAAVMLCICALAAGTLTGCCGTGDPVSGAESGQSVEIKRAKGTYDIDVRNPAEMAGFADYVFVGYVERFIETEYNEAYPFPFTHYSVRVLENIKGNLRVGEPINFMKHGGVEKDGDAIWLFEEDELPDIGRLYVFLGVASRDHTVVRDCVPFSNIPLEEALQGYGAAITAEQYASSEVVQRYREAYANEVPYNENERFHSIYEEGYAASEDGLESGADAA